MKVLALLLTLLSPPDRAEMECMALTLYFEARGEPFAGQWEVAQVVLARVSSEDYPETVCGVVKQAKKPGRFNCQFTWWCDGRGDDPRNLVAYRQALGLSFFAMKVGPAPTAPTHYHATYVEPKDWDWSQFEVVSQVGGHVFYRENN